MDCTIREDALKYLQAIVGQPIGYGIKSPDLDLYDFGFGNAIEIWNAGDVLGGRYSFVLHAICSFKIVEKSTQRAFRYYGDSLPEKFHFYFKSLLGLRVEKIELNNKNDLKIDFGDVYIVFYTIEDGDESWRFFTSKEEDPHLVASNLWLRFD